MEIDIKSKAYYKIMLHCLKYLISDCYGFLLGEKKNDKYIITDVVPYSHTNIFSSSFSVAISMIKKLYPKEKILGFYENLIVNQMKEEPAISNQASFICEMIGKNNGFNSVYFQIYSKDSGKKDKDYLEDEIFFKKFILNDENFSFIDNEVENEEEFKMIKKFCTENRQQDIIDFDDHLDNPNLDWRNTFVE